MLCDGQGMCFPEDPAMGLAPQAGFGKFQVVDQGDLLMVLANTAHGGSAHSSVESLTGSSLCDLKLFIDCPGLSDPTHPSAGTIINQQSYYDTISDADHAAFLEANGSYRPSIHYF
jgi:hypothetical protein